ncbi:MAG: Serine/threonine-protein kinase PknD [Phycisphaerae bacterium]|nr:Serine/threonine-protein kinase PknD [Phycisphaerae bacterium]
MNNHRESSEDRALARLEELFFAALDLPTERRDAYLDEQCGGDAGLRAAVARMLRADRGRGGVIDNDSWCARRLAERLPQGSEDDPLAAPGVVIGGYRLAERIGMGGMGTVWRAHRADQAFERTVAIKLIKRGMDSEEITRRFRLERQVLARLDHPHIARLYDGGSTTDGRPYLVMEYIDGMAILPYCGYHALAVDAILRLFRTVCDAIQFAHSNLILHRDIKPGNVLVTSGGQVKLLDFGIAKLLDGEDASLTMSSRQGALTPRYASPEQIRGERLSTACDVYALGVLLFELLTGEWPYGSDAGGLREVERLICEREPSRPSQVISPESAATSSRRRLIGDLDWVILKCLAKDPRHRYASAAELADEIARHLQNQPVLAGPPSITYRASKFLRRNRAAVIAGLAIAGMLATATTISLRFALSESHQRRLAVEAGAAAFEQQRVAAARAADAALQAEIARAVSAFLNDDLLLSIAPSSEPGQGRDVPLRAVLDRASERIDAACAPRGRFDGKPTLEAEIRATLGDAYSALGEYEPAESHLRRALALERLESHGETARTVGLLRRLGLVLCRRGNLDEALPLIHEAVELGHAELGPRDAATLNAIEALGIWMHDCGRYGEALEQFSLAHAGYCDVFGPEHPSTLGASLKIGGILQDMGRFDEASPHFDTAIVGLQHVFGADDPRTLAAQRHFGRLRVDMGDYENALELFESALGARRRICGQEHVDTLQSEHDLGDLLKKMGRYEEALPLYQAALDGRRRMLGEVHATTLTSMRGLASVFQSLGRFSEAEPHMRRSLELTFSLLGADHPTSIEAASSLGSLLFSMERLEEAERLTREAFERRSRVLGADHPETLDSMNNLAAILRKMRRFDEAEPLVRESLDRRRRTLGDNHPSTLYSLNTLGVLLVDMRRFDEAEPLVRETYERRRDALGEDHPSTMTARMNLAGLFDMSGQLAEALPHHLSVLDSRRRTQGEDHVDTLRSKSVIATLLGKLGRPEEAEQLAAEAVSGARRSLPADHVGIGIYLANHGKLLTELRRFDDAEGDLLEACDILETKLGRDERRAVWARGLLRELMAAREQVQDVQEAVRAGASKPK